MRNFYNVHSKTDDNSALIAKLERDSLIIEIVNKGQAVKIIKFLQKQGFDFFADPAVREYLNPKKQSYENKNPVPDKITFKHCKAAAGK